VGFMITGACSICQVSIMDHGIFHQDLYSSQVIKEGVVEEGGYHANNECVLELSWLRQLLPFCGDGAKRYAWSFVQTLFIPWVT
jgi:hypothetical protein